MNELVAGRAARLGLRSRRRFLFAGIRDFVEADVETLVLAVYPAKLLERQPDVIQFTGGADFNKGVHIWIAGGPAPPNLRAELRAKRDLRCRASTRPPRFATFTFRI